MICESVLPSGFISCALESTDFCEKSHDPNLIRSMVMIGKEVFIYSRQPGRCRNHFFRHARRPSPSGTGKDGMYKKDILLPARTAGKT